jgi:hypothetical protein
MELEIIQSKIYGVSEEALAAINDLSEDNHKEFDDIYLALSQLAEKKKLQQFVRKNNGALSCS